MTPAQRIITLEYRAMSPHLRGILCGDYSRAALEQLAAKIRLLELARKVAEAPGL